MDFQTDLKYQQLKKVIDSTAVDLENCSHGEYLPQKRRLHTWALADMGDFLYNKDLYSDALTYYTLAKKFDCDEASVLNQMGICLMHLGKIDRSNAAACSSLYEYFKLFLRASMASFNPGVLR